MTKRTTTQLKAEFLKFYAEFPVQKAGADFIDVDEDTITNWKKRDPAFSEAVRRAKSEWAKKNFRKVSPHGLLSRLYADTLPPKQEVEQTGLTQVTINHVKPNDQLPSVAETGAGLPVPDGQDDN